MQILPQYMFAVASWLLTVQLIWSVWKAIAEGMTQLKKLHEIPCSRCAYFTGDYHLKCPIYPSNALTEDAISCRDFSPI
jgi:hypothetical protein